MCLILIRNQSIITEKKNLIEIKSHHIIINRYKGKVHQQHEMYIDKFKKSRSKKESKKTRK
jgi:acyl-ACP thioesterase